MIFYLLYMKLLLINVSYMYNQNYIVVVGNKF